MSQILDLPVHSLTSVLMMSEATGKLVQEDFPYLINFVPFPSDNQVLSVVSGCFTNSLLEFSVLLYVKNSTSIIQALFFNTDFRKTKT